MHTAALEQQRQLAWQAHHSGDLLTAEQLYRNLLEQQGERPDRRDAINLGALLRTQGRLKEAQIHYAHYLQQLPEDLNLRLNGVNALLDSQSYPQALEWLDQGLALHSNDLQLRQAQAKTFLGLGQAGQARQLLEQLTRQSPTTIGLWLDLGLVCHNQQDLPAALAAFERVAQLNPDDPRGAANRLTILKEMGRFKDAEQLIAQLPASISTDLLVRGAVAGLLIQQQRHEEAAVALAELSRLEPENPVHWLNQAACLRSLKHMMACTQVLKQGLRRHPTHRDLQQALAQSMAEMGRHQAALELLRRSVVSTDQLSDSHLFNMQFLGAGYHLISPEERKTMARSWEQRKAAAGVGPLWGDRIHEPLAGRPLRVGYLSADLANHPVGRFLLPILRQHDRTCVEVWGLSCGPHVDVMQSKLKDACDHWLDLRFGTDLEAARVIADEELDLVVELGGFTGNSRLGVLVHRPARVQLSYLGYYAPTYLQAIDGWIGDAELFGGLDITDQGAHRLLEVDGGYMAFVPEDVPGLEDRCSSARLRFGSFNHARKLTPETIALFCGVLEANPESELVLKSISFVEPAEQERVRRQFEQAGLAADRLVILPWVEGWSSHMALYKEVDVALDPLPYGGATTSCEALWMGVPVVSLAGRGMVGRLSASVLASATCGGWIARSSEHFIALTKQLAAAGLRDLRARQSLRQQVLGSPLADPVRLCRGLEQTYRQVCS